MGGQSRRIVEIVALAAGLATACGDASDRDKLPAGWEGAQNLMIEQSMCNGGAMPASPTLELTETGGMIAGLLQNIVLRCQQKACAYVTDSGATTRVLVQPCDLHPTVVPKCDCENDVTFTLPARADRTTVEAYRRFDFYGASTPPQPVLVASKAVGGN